MIGLLSHSYPRFNIGCKCRLRQSPLIPCYKEHNSQVYLTRSSRANLIRVKLPAPGSLSTVNFLEYALTLTPLATCASQQRGSQVEGKEANWLAGPEGTQVHAIGISYTEGSLILPLIHSTSLHLTPPKCCYHNFFQSFSHFDQTKFISL